MSLVPIGKAYIEEPAGKGKDKREMGPFATRMSEYVSEHPGMVFMTLTFGPIITLICVLSVFMPGWAVGFVAIVLSALAGWFCCVNFNATFLVALDRTKALDKKVASLEQALRTGAEAFLKEQEKNKELEARLNPAPKKTQVRTRQTAREIADKYAKSP